MSVSRPPAKIILVHGTWARGFDPESHVWAKAADRPAEPLWFEAGSKFCTALGSGLADPVAATNVTAFLWSGANSIEQRYGAANLLAKTIDESVAGSPEAPHFIIAHSHGGNVALDARQAMSGDARNVHLVTMATPFLSIKQRKLRLLDSIFAAFIAFGIVALLAVYLLPHIGGHDGPNDDSSNFWIYVILLICLSSIAVGATTWLGGIYRRIRKKQISDGFLWKHLNSVRQINNRSLLASGVLSVVATILEPSAIGEVTIIAFVASLPVMIVAFVLASAIGSCLYKNEIAPPTRDENIANMTILRSRRDEATLALFVGKITSFLARAAASVSIVVSLGAVVLILAALSFVIYYAASRYHAYEQCVALLGGRPNNGQCTVPGEIIIMGLLGVSEWWGKSISYYFIFGLGGCLALIFVTALCKSFFGRELLYRSLNTMVDVYDTPRGVKSLGIDWCAQVEGAMLNLRHSLYNNPDAVKKIVAYINRICAPGDNAA